MAYRITRSNYAEIYGPTVGDRVRLGDTSLLLEVEQDFAVYGDECKFGGGKVLLGEFQAVNQFNGRSSSIYSHKTFGCRDFESIVSFHKGSNTLESF